MGTMKSAEVSNHRRGCSFCQQHYGCTRKEMHEAFALPMPLEGDRELGWGWVHSNRNLHALPQKLVSQRARSEKPRPTRQSHSPSEAAQTPFCFQSLRKRTPRGEGMDTPQMQLMAGHSWWARGCSAETRSMVRRLRRR